MASAESSEFDTTLKELRNTVLLSEPLSPEEDRRILRRIDMYLLPVMAISYLFQFLDKSAMGYTSIFGLINDLHLVGQDYAWASSIFYSGYLAFSYPSALIMNRFPVGKFLALSVTLWSAVLLCTAATQDAAGLQATRFFLGFTEAAVAPGFGIITSMYYKRSEQPLRMGAWFMGNVCAGLFGALLAYGVGHITVIEPWRAVFIIFGAITIVWAVSLFYTLPDTPMNARFLSKEDRIKAIERVKDNMTGIKNNKWKKEQVIDALTDPKTWFIFFIGLCCNIPNGGITGFGSIVIKGLGFSTLSTLLVQMLSVVFQAIYVLSATGGSTYLSNTRTYWMALMMIISLVGSVMIRSIDHSNIWGRFMGYCLLIAFSANFPMSLTMVAANTGGFTKKTTVSAMLFIAYTVGNIIGPQLFFEHEAPGYDSGFVAMLICFSAGVFFCFGLRFYLIWENKRRDARGGEPVLTVNGVEVDGTAALNLLDMTDREMLQFRYLY
ncbi:major facilitator superfamily domain-containing protein [Rhexocercosporidium sp. MPI-PUGE-AT-0058]|nr:major facilitator superfamily domain-containing protein [Rhexocercosporidium sp. MPI-PUGE-AT-0058]